VQGWTILRRSGIVVVGGVEFDAMARSAFAFAAFEAFLKKTIAAPPHQRTRGLAGRKTMERPWYASYPETVSRHVDIKGHASALGLAEAAFQTHREASAYVCLGRELTYGDLDRLSRQLASAFQHMGLKPGDRLAIMMPNVLHYPVALFAAWRAGLIVVNVNPLYTPRELNHQLNDSGAKAIVILDRFLSVLATESGKTPIEHTVIAGFSDNFGAADPVDLSIAPELLGKIPSPLSFDHALASGRENPGAAVPLHHDDVAVLQYTGGTTGVSKGAVLTHANLLSALLGARDWMQPGLDRRPPSGQLNFVCALPLYHVFAFMICGLFASLVGGNVILIPDPRDMAGTVKQLAPYKLHVFPAVNTLFNGLINTPSFAGLDFSELGVTIGGGAAVQEVVARKWLAITGCPIIEGYGLSETCATATCNRSDLEAFTGTIGLPGPGVDIAILDDDENEVAHGQPGEICMKGGQVMRGYWERPEETAKAFTRSGYFKTGDIGLMDDEGFVTIIDRKKDMIIVSGFNVFPNEIEGVVAEHPRVVECAVIGVPDEQSGEAVMLFVVPRDGGLGADELVTFCQERLTGYKRPRRIEFIDALPKSNVGKILRRELRDEVMKRPATPMAMAG
jgi:long-chain acyl-CoA synthetase